MADGDFDLMEKLKGLEEEKKEKRRS